MVRSASAKIVRIKKSLRQLGLYLDGRGPPPLDLIEGRVIERFGWTFDELDRSDEGRTLRTVAVLNSADAYRQTMEAIASHRTEAIPASHWNLWNSVRQAMVDDVPDDSDPIPNSNSKESEQ